jgi:hypothetical protein
MALPRNGPVSCSLWSQHNALQVSVLRPQDPQDTARVSQKTYCDHRRGLGVRVLRVTNLQKAAETRSEISTRVSATFCRFCNKPLKFCHGPFQATPRYTGAQTATSKDLRSPLCGAEPLVFPLFVVVAVVVYISRSCAVLSAPLRPVPLQ